MVRAIIFISALLIAAISAIPTPDPVAAIKTNKYIGVGKVKATHVGKNLLNLNGLSVKGNLTLNVLIFLSDILFLNR